jgi:hypothetical protein
MRRKRGNTSNATNQCQMELSRWDNEGGAGHSAQLEGLQFDDGARCFGLQTEMDLFHLHVRIIALENLLIALLAKCSDQQISVARDMASYISPRPGFTQHPLTIRAANLINDLVRRSIHFRFDP